MAQELYAEISCGKLLGDVCLEDREDVQISITMDGTKKIARMVNDGNCSMAD
jgi:hypothetical protein